MRNVICISDFPLALHEWVKEEAKRRGEGTGRRYAVALVFQEAVRDLKAKLDNHAEEAGPSPE
ncbi:hypothetical protein LCGC14_1361570 [marine sediment metagenome]|uniref:Uncharacterized protein n=1 Tax=marine sediment metagenome TaxID=412755 RepID=A0A0F9NA94_9ZZZZ